MKLDSHTTRSYVTAFAAFLMLTVNAVAAAAAFTAFGLAAMLFLDYGRPMGPATVKADVVAFEAPGPGASDEREAA
jgi:hypothetical protein